ncbi:MAG TPA: hypothetical protein VHG08_19970 [Longimicrobium sp.]|nr:hypothetical protein [Longimicrobium sp.]
MMRRMLVMAGAVLALAGCAAGMGGGGAPVPPQFIGRWVGVGTQSDQPGEWTIDATIVGGPVEQIGTISYPSLECGGVLLFRSAEGGRLEVREDITYGSCVDQGIITLTPTGDGALRYDWRMDGSDLTAQGTLTRAR